MMSASMVRQMMKLKKSIDYFYVRERHLKKIIIFLPLLINSTSMIAAEKNIILESPVIKMADGTFINADKVEFIRKFCRTLISFLKGEQQANNQRKGKYHFCGKWHSVESLARIEQELATALSQETDLKKRTAIENNLAALEEVLIHVKADFIVQSTEFIESGRGAKGITVILIQEDCQKRNRPDSLLLEWAKTKEGQEATMFEYQINSFNDYSHFLTDLINFLLDLVHSCPKAESQFKERVEKWSTVKTMLPMILKKAHIKSDDINEIEFLKYLKERYLDSIALHEITPQVITPLLKEYIKHSYTHHA